MRIETMQKPEYSMVKITFENAGESLAAESGAMVAKDPNVVMKTSMKGGLLASAKRKLLGGESLFLNTFTAGAPGQTMYLAAAPEGDTVQFDVKPGEPLFMHSGAFLAAHRRGIEPTQGLAGHGAQARGGCSIGCHFQRAAAPILHAQPGFVADVADERVVHAERS